MNNIVEQETVIDAPVKVVWNVITQPDQVAKWLSTGAEFDLDPGSRGRLVWDNMGEAPMTVVTVDEPNEFSFRWVALDEQTTSIDGETLVSFNLSADGEKTRVRVVESGFDDLTLSEAQKHTLRNKHALGWPALLGNAKDYIARLD